MGVTVGIRREDKNKWERRVPLIPADVADLQRDHKINFIVQPSPIRVFSDTDYENAGVAVNEDITSANIVVAVKEIPEEMLREKTVYLDRKSVV